jgi:hypothetical protein
LKHVGAKIQDKIQIVISCDFNNKKRVHFVGIIIVYIPLYYVKCYLFSLFPPFSFSYCSDFLSSSNFTLCNKC